MIAEHRTQSADVGDVGEFGRGFQPPGKVVAVLQQPARHLDVAPEQREVGGERQRPGV